VWFPSLEEEGVEDNGSLKEEDGAEDGGGLCEVIPESETPLNLETEHFGCFSAALHHGYDLADLKDLTGTDAASDFLFDEALPPTSIYDERLPNVPISTPFSPDEPESPEVTSEMSTMFMANDPFQPFTTTPDVTIDLGISPSTWDDNSLSVWPISTGDTFDVPHCNGRNPGTAPELEEFGSLFDPPNWLIPSLPPYLELGDAQTGTTFNDEVCNAANQRTETAALAGVLESSSNLKRPYSDNATSPRRRRASEQRRMECCGGIQRFSCSYASWDWIPSSWRRHDLNRHLERTRGKSRRERKDLHHLLV